MTSVIVSGPLANKPHNGGIAWNVLSYVLGLKRLGLHVLFVEEIGSENCVDIGGHIAPFQLSLNLEYFRTVVEQFELQGEAILIYDRGSQVYGATKEELHVFAEEASILINISGHLTLAPAFSRIPSKVYVDEDPGFTQFWHAIGNPGIRLAGHDAYYTVGENIGRPGCLIPTDEIDWRPTRQPVVLDCWPVAPPPAALCFTTVASWRGAYGQVEYEGRRFGLKVHEFRKFLTIPERTGSRFEIALDIHANDAKDRDQLCGHGWSIVDPHAVASDPVSFRRYVQSSSAEFSAAQGIYVETGSGWFSDRSARYLASGKPVVVQDTGFARSLPCGDGLLAFRNIDEAVAAVERIVSDYDKHSRTARALAEEYFDSDKVLRRLLEHVM